MMVLLWPMIGTVSDEEMNKKIAEGEPDNIKNNQEVINAYFGSRKIA